MRICRRESRDAVACSSAHRRTPKRDVTSSIAQTITSRLGRSTISAAISLSIVAVAAFALYELLHDIDFGKVAAALRAQSIEKIVAAGAFVVAGYVTLTFYDLFALRTIGRHKVPYSVAALASFTSSTIGHSLGAAMLTGGLIRLRIYSVWGLTVVDIAKIAFVTGMTFWFGNALLLGGAMAYAPEAATAIDHLPSSINRAIGLAGLIGIACYLLWLAPRPRAVGRSGWRILLPNLRFTLVQRHRRAGPLPGDARHVRAAAVEPGGWLRDRAGHLPDRDIARNAQSCARRTWRHRGHDADRACPIRAGGTPGGVADVSRALLRPSACPGNRIARIVGIAAARASDIRSPGSRCVTLAQTL